MSDISIKAVGLGKWYGQVTALQDVSFRVEKGIWGLLGPNGSGKSSFLGLTSGQLQPSIGKIEVFGSAPFANPDVLKRVGVCPEADALPENLSALEFVSSMAELSGMRPTDAKEKATRALTQMSLQDAQHRRMGTYSRGMRQRAKLAQALVHDPDILLLDEPLTGTDPISRKQILDELERRASAGALVVFSSHILAEVETITDQLVLLVRGKLLAQGKSEEIRDLLHEYPHVIRIQCDAPRKLAASLAHEISIDQIAFRDNDEVEFHSSSPDAAFEAIAKASAAHDGIVHSLSSPETNMETLFHYLVARSGKMAGSGADASKREPKQGNPS